MPCPSQETVDAFVAGRLSGAACTAVEDHLPGCPTCRERTETLGTPRTATLGPAGDARIAAAPFRGRQLGRYLLLENAGAGGMGTVFAAYDTVLERKVALKVLTRAASNPGAIDRVLAEASAMARLSHPNVVTVHDVGVLEGIPYLSMELVEGTTLEVWREQAPRSFREIARVMAAAARGLAAAHAASIVHRDVKPQNVLVAGARVLVTDFGLSVPDDGDAQPGLAGTPAYMAPEQLRGEKVDARADVFGFCATLYELIYGAPPFPARSFDEARAHLTAGRAAQPPPGARVPTRLARLALRGLEADPTRRPSDLDRVADELLADPARRLRQGAVAVGIAAAVAGAFWGGAYLRANPERQCRLGAEVIARDWNDARRAQLRQRYAAAGQQAIWPLLERRLDDFAASWRATYGETCATSNLPRGWSDAVFDLKIHCLTRELATVQAFLDALPSASVTQLVRAPGALLPETASCALAGGAQTKPLPADPEQRAQIAAIEQAVAVSAAAELLGDYPRSFEAASQAVGSARKVGYEPVLASVLVRLGSIDTERASNSSSNEPSGLDRAATTLEEAYAVADRGGDDSLRLTAARVLVLVHNRRGQFAESLRWEHLAEALLTRVGAPVSEAAALAFNVGWLKWRMGKDDESRAAFARSLELSGRISPPDPRRVAEATEGLCILKVDRPEAIACLRRALDLARAAYGEQHPGVGRYYSNLGNLLIGYKNTVAEACPLLRKALELQAPGIDRASPSTMITLDNLANCYKDAGQIAEADRVFADAVARHAGPSDRAKVYESYGVFLCNWGDKEAGLRYLEMALADHTAVEGPTHERTLITRVYIAQVLQDMGRWDEGTRRLDEIVAFCRRHAPDSRSCTEALGQKALDLHRRKRFGAARRLFQEEMQTVERLRANEDVTMPLYGLGVTNLDLGHLDQAIGYLERALQQRPATLSSSPGFRAMIAFALARALAAKGGDHARACDLFREAADIYRDDIPIERQRHLGETERWLARQRCAAATRS